jgi:plastocyanin
MIPPYHLGIPMRPTSSLLALLLTSPALAATPPVTMTLKNHVFSPSTITVPAGEKITIELTNHDMATEEFDSHDLKVEKLVTPGGRVTFTIGPLAAGDYSFMGEFHPATAQGHVIAGGH